MRNDTNAVLRIITKIQLSNSVCADIMTYLDSSDRPYKFSGTGHFTDKQTID